MVYLASGGFWLTLGQVSIAAIAFALSIAFAHFVPKETYGTYRFLLSLFWTLTAFSLTGIPTALARAIAKGEDGAYNESLRLSVIWSFPMALIALGFSGYYFFQGNVTLGWGSLIIAVLGPLMQGAYLYGAFLEGKKAFQTNAVAGIVLNLVPALLLFAAMFISKNPLWYLLAYLAGSVGTAGLISVFVTKRFRNTEKKPGESLFKLGTHFSAMNILGTMSGQIDRLLIYHFLGATQLAVYIFATAMPDQIKSILNGVSTLAFPKFANRPLSEIIPTLQHRIRNFTMVIVIFALAYIVLAPFIFHLFFPAYVESIFYSQLYALTLLAISNVIPIALLQAHAAKRELYIFNVASPAFQILVLLALVAPYGLIGAIVARILGRIFNMTLCNYLMHSYQKRVLI